MPAGGEEAMVAELRSLQEKYGFELPDRGDLDDPGIQWRDGRPDFTRVDLAFLRGRSTNHRAGSLEKVVEDLVKRWEMEMSHKVDYHQWTSVDHQRFSLTANNGRTFSGKEVFEQGNYQALLSGCRRQLYDPDQHNFQTSHNLFRTAFPEGFAWEVVRVFSPPPKVAFTWRHWAEFSGNFEDVPGSGDTVEMYGFTIATVSDDLRIQTLEVYYDPDSFLEVLKGMRPAEDLKGGKTIVGSGCPLTQQKKE